MSLTLLLVGIVLFAFVGGRWLARLAAPIVTLSGAEYILVGFLIGPRFAWSILNEAALQQLIPLVNLLLGLAGFTLGLRARHSAPSPDLGVAALVTALLTWAGCSIAFVAALTHWMPRAGHVDFFLQHEVLRSGDRVLEIWVSSEQLLVAVGLGACATVSSSALLSATLQRRGARGKVSDLLLSIANVSEVVSVSVLGLLLASSRATSSGSTIQLTIVEWGLSTVALGVVSGILFGLFIGRESEPTRIFLATLGLVTFASGVGSALGVSPLFINLLAGATVSALSPHSERISAELTRLNHPLFVLLMIFAGTLWAPTAGWLWLMPVLYAVVRLVALRASALFADRAVLPSPTRAAGLGYGLVGQGTLAVAIAVNLVMRAEEHGAVVLTTVLLGVLLSDLFSTRWLLSTLADAGELDQVEPGSEIGGGEGAAGGPAGGAAGAGKKTSRDSDGEQHA